MRKIRGVSLKSLGQPDVRYSIGPDTIVRAKVGAE
jgi:hypothetical protein